MVCGLDHSGSELFYAIVRKLTSWQRRLPMGTAGRECPQIHSEQTCLESSCAVREKEGGTEWEGERVDGGRERQNGEGGGGG